mmetsp:Transcript_24393/g.63608  ORF Transcript_24393/g.63608 Transcript_24393/m.63608 type:complete len:99 (+) Transcript_24393:14-310(+)
MGDAPPAPMETEQAAAVQAPAAVPEDLAATAASEQQVAAASGPDVRTIPVRQYLDKTVVPVLNEGLAELSKTRPENPIEWLAAYLLKNKDSYPGLAAN